MYMTLKKTVMGILLWCSLLVYMTPSQAGLVWFSRANCINNESVTWDWPGNVYWLWTNSFHYKNGVWDHIYSGWYNGYWAAGIHAGEGFAGGYFVMGDHYQYLSGAGVLYLGRTQTTGCNLGYFFPYW